MTKKRNTPTPAEVNNRYEDHLEEFTDVFGKTAEQDDEEEWRALLRELDEEARAHYPDGRLRFRAPGLKKHCREEGPH